MAAIVNFNGDIAINGWFAGDRASGSGQYLNHLLMHLPQVAPAARFSLLLPTGRSVETDPPVTWRTPTAAALEVSSIP